MPTSSNQGSLNRAPPPLPPSNSTHRTAGRSGRPNKALYAIGGNKAASFQLQQQWGPSASAARALAPAVVLPHAEGVTSTAGRVLETVALTPVRKTLLPDESLEKMRLQIQIDTLHIDDKLQNLASLAGQGLLSPAEFYAAKQLVLQTGRTQHQGNSEEPELTARFGDQHRPHATAQPLPQLPPRSENARNQQNASHQQLDQKMHALIQRLKHRNINESVPHSTQLAHESTRRDIITNNRGSSKANTTMDDTAVSQWLKAHRLEAYAVQFDREGYDDLEQIAQLGASEVTTLLKRIPMKPGHEQKFIKTQWDLAKEDKADTNLDLAKDKNINTHDSSGASTNLSTLENLNVNRGLHLPATENVTDDSQTICIQTMENVDFDTKGPGLEHMNATKQQRQHQETTQLERLQVARRSIQKSIGSLILATMLLSCLLGVAPVYIFGEMVGSINTAGGLKWVGFIIMWARVGPHVLLCLYIQEQTFATIVQGLGWRLKPRWRWFWILAPTICLSWGASESFIIWFGDDADLRFPFGRMHWDVGPVIPRVLAPVLGMMWVVIWIGGVPAWILWQRRNEPIDHGPRKYSWWNASVYNRARQPGMNTAAILVPCAFFVLQFNFWVTFPFLYYDDRAKAAEQQCHPDCFQGLITTRLYPVALVASMVMSLWWGKKLPRHRRDLVAGFLLTVCSCIFAFVAANTVFTFYVEFGAGLGVLGVQTFFEVLMMAVYLWARTLASRAVPTDPSGEAKLLIWVIFLGDAFAEVAFVNLEFGSTEFWVLVMLDFFMIVMRDADLWDELSKLLKNLCGERLGKWLSFGLAVAGGDDDVAVNQLDNELDHVEGTKTRKRRFIKMRMVSSQAVASEFVVTGCFLAISAACYVLNQNGVVAYMQLIPAEAGVSADCIDPCVCDENGIVGGAFSNIDGGCVLRPTLPIWGGLLSTDASMIVEPLCLVPAACQELGNSTNVIRAAIPDYNPLASYSYRICTIDEPTSDVCDPGPAQVRDNVLSFMVVFAIQLLALLVSKIIIMWKTRKMVDKNNRDRRRRLFNVLNAQTLAYVDAFVKREELQEDQHQVQMRSSEGLTPKQRILRGVRAMMFVRRLKASAKKKYTVDGMMLEVTEAVAQHWKEIWIYYLVFVVATMQWMFVILAGMTAIRET